MPSKTAEQGIDKNKNSLLESFLAHRNQLFGLIGRIVRPDEIEDIVQETFVQSYAAARHQQIRNPRNFMFRTARNLALNSVNRSEHKLNSSIEEIQDFDISSEVDLVEEGYQSEQNFLSFCRAVATLPVICRKVFILKKVYGLSQKEIASFLQIAPSTVEKHIARGMSATADYMCSAGYTNIARSKNSASNTIHEAHEKEQTT